MAIDNFEYAKLGQVFMATNQAGVTLSALSNTATGLVLCNPYGSGKNLAVLRVQWAFSTAPAGASVVGIAASAAISQTAVTHTTPMSIYQSYFDGSAGKSIAKVDSSATTVGGTPVFIRALGGPVAASQINPPFISCDVRGEIIIPPGMSIQLAYLTTAAVGMGSIVWLEYNA